MNALESDHLWDRIAKYENLSKIDKEHLVAKIDHLLYWINADRFYWKNGDLHCLAEAFFAMGNVVSICRVCFLLPVIAFVGPLQVNIFSLK